MEGREGERGPFHLFMSNYAVINWVRVAPLMGNSAGGVMSLYRVSHPRQTLVELT